MASCLALVSCVLAASFIQAAVGIMGGQKASEGQFPYLASVRYGDRPICGASIISANYIITAAHCVLQKDNPGLFKNDLRVKVGSNNINNGGFFVDIEGIRLHDNPIYNDIALIKLQRPLQFSMHIQTIVLAKSEPPEKKQVTIAGWGREKDNGYSPENLKWDFVRSISRIECSKRRNINTPHLICMDHGKNLGPCHGDSGGPAVFKKQLVGILYAVYKGYGANVNSQQCGTTKPDLYINIVHYLPWIKKYTDIV